MLRELISWTNNVREVKCFFNYLFNVLLFMWKMI
ncbi:hypothetical protein DET57_11563 [Klebsiella oxytoca]|uniref:Uncharacterized protein n=1 Tax=Klebsiella oxytoca TaxID=571 RepID=A0A318FJR4_KLEOX|nr:hypothetical protein DET57_11563 [Klebsiella oxytoca]